MTDEEVMIATGLNEFDPKNGTVMRYNGRNSFAVSGQTPNATFGQIIKRRKRSCSVARLIWTYVHGPIPEGFVIARIDNDPCNSRIQNLRLVRRSCLIPEETIPLGQLVVRLGYCSVRGTKVVDRDNRIVEFVEFAKAGREYRVMRKR